MTTFDRATTLRHELLVFGDWLDDPLVTEICVNRPGTAFVERSGAWQREPRAELALGRLLSLANAAAVMAGQPFGETDPILSASLPGGERAQFVCPPAVPAGTLSVTIRKPSMFVPRLADYAGKGFFGGGRRSAAGREDLHSLYRRAKTLDEEAALQFLKAAVRRQMNIVVAGETGSGKTTLMKALMQEIPETERIITIEDVPELLYGLPRHENQVNLFYPSEGGGVTASSLLRSALRMKPDRILVAELRGGETFDFLTAALSGHGGSITSCHAGSVDEAFSCLTLRTLQSGAGSRLPYRAIGDLLRAAVDVVLHVTARGGSRRMDEVWCREGEEP